MATFVDRLNHAIALREGELGTHIYKKDLARAAAVSPSAVTQWLQGTTEELKAASLFGLAAYLKVRPEWLWKKEGPIRAGSAAQKAAATEEPLAAKVSQPAARFIATIEAADRDGLISGTALQAFQDLFERFIEREPSVADLTSQRSIERAEQLVASHQPKQKKGKGAA